MWVLRHLLMSSSPTKRVSTPAMRAETFKRLATPVPDRSRTPLPPLVQTRTLTKEEEKNSIERLFTRSCEHKKQTVERIQVQVYGNPAGEKVTLDRDTTEQVITRMYNGARDKEEGLERARERYFKKYVVPKKKFESKDTQEQAIDRLYNTTLKEKQKMEYLFEKYNPKIEFLKRSSEELKANDARYYEGGFARRDGRSSSPTKKTK